MRRFGRPALLLLGIVLALAAGELGARALWRIAPTIPEN